MIVEASLPVVGQWQAHPPPQPRMGAAAGEGTGSEPPERLEAKTDSSRRASVWPEGQATSVSASAMDRRCSNSSSQAMQRYSYRGTPARYNGGVTGEQRCPACGMELGEVVSTRYKGNLTVLRYRPPGAADNGEALEHVCGDSNLPT